MADQRKELKHFQDLIKGDRFIFSEAVWTKTSHSHARPEGGTIDVFFASHNVVEPVDDGELPNPDELRSDD